MWNLFILVGFLIGRTVRPRAIDFDERSRLLTPGKGCVCASHFVLHDAAIAFVASAGKKHVRGPPRGLRRAVEAIQAAHSWQGFARGRDSRPSNMCQSNVELLRETKIQTWQRQPATKTSPVAPGAVTNPQPPCRFVLSLCLCLSLSLYLSPPPPPPPPPLPHIHSV
jgi:hypothetical protein